MSDYTLGDLAVFESMPDTATKAEIREAIDADRARRGPAPRCLYVTIDTILGVIVPCTRPAGHLGEHADRRTS